MVSDEQTKQMEHYVDQLLAWNKKVNLISRQDEELVWQNHILHSISPLFKLKLKDSPTILDLGTGGGLPGIPLRILLPDSEIILIDATRKKIIAVDDMLAKLKLQSIRALWGRVEELTREESLVCHFDYIITRAVAPLNDLITWCKPFLRRSPTALHSAENVYPSPTALIALKGGDLEEEISKASRGDKIRSIEVLDLVFPGSEEMSSIGKKIVVVRF